MAAAAALGAVVGIVLGVFGGGGSVLAVPALVYVLGLPAAQAVPTSLVVVEAAALVGTLPRLRTGDIHWRAAALFGGPGIAAAPAGAWLNHRLPGSAVMLGFSLLMAAVAVHLLRDRRPDTARDRADTSRRTVIMAAGATVGLLTGLFGVGGGFLIVPALVIILGLPMNAAIATSLVVIMLTAGAGLAGHLGHTSLDLRIAGAFTAGAVAASLYGAHISRTLDATRLRRWFGALVLVVAAGVAAAVVLLDGPTVG